MRWLWQRIRQWRRVVGRNAITIRRLGLSQSDPTDEPGLMLIQIDGLSRSQLELAIRRRRMPFVGHLIDKKEYQLHTMYSGLPSTTPAVQGELFYGVPCVVPAFAFRDPATGSTIRMVDSEAAAAMFHGGVYRNIGSPAAAGKLF